MKKAIAIILIATTATWFLKAQIPAKKETPKYTVTMSREEWGGTINGIESVKNFIKQSDLKAKDVTFICDSILSPIQDRFIQQINVQIQNQADSTKKKK